MKPTLCIWCPFIFGWHIQWCPTNNSCKWGSRSHHTLQHKEVDCWWWRGPSNTEVSQDKKWTAWRVMEAKFQLGIITKPSAWFGRWLRRTLIDTEQISIGGTTRDKKAVKWRDLIIHLVIRAPYTKTPPRRSRRILCPEMHHTGYTSLRYTFKRVTTKKPSSYCIFQPQTPNLWGKLANRVSVPLILTDICTRSV